MIPAAIVRASKVVLSTALFVFAAGTADAADTEAEIFADLFLKTCMKHVTAPQKLRDALIERKIPPLPPEKARHFLGGRPGSAWPLPSKVGDFVLSLTDRGICAVYARRAEQREVERLFEMLVAKSPSGMPMQSRKEKDEVRQTANGEAHSVEYRWSTPDAPRELQFILTTSASKDAGVQALATAALIGREQGN